MEVPREESEKGGGGGEPSDALVRKVKIGLFYREVAAV